MIKTFTGVAYLAAMHRKFPLHALKVFKGIDRPAMAVLWGFFGKNRKPMIEYMRMCSNRPHFLEIYLLHRWGDPIGGKDRDKLSKLIENRNPRIMRKIRKRILKITKFVDKYANNNTYPVMGYDLESRMTKKAIMIVAEEVDKIWPYDTCSISHTGIPGADFVEHHHDRQLKRGEVGSLDGQEIRFSHRDGNYGKDSLSEAQAHIYMRKNYNKATAVMYWSKLHQGLTGNTETSKPPKKRDIRVPIGDIKWMRNSIKRVQ